MTIEEVSKDTLLDLIRTQKISIQELKDENRTLRKTIQEMERYREDTYILMSEAFRYKRMLECMDDERRVLSEKLEKERARLEKAERSIRNLQKWMELKGIKGGWYSE